MQPLSFLHGILCLLMFLPSSSSVVIHKYYEVEPNDQAIQANKAAMVPPFIVFASLKDASDYDWFNLTVSQRGDYVMETYSPSCQNNVGSTDTEIELFSANDLSHALITDDDSGVELASKVATRLEEGTYYLRIRSFSHFSRNSLYELSFGLEGTQFCERDCVWSSWSDWSTCSRSCGSGSVTRRRTSSICDAQVYNLPCNTIPCTQTTTTCSIGEWSSWGDCDHDSCTSERYRAKNFPSPMPLTSRGNCTAPFVLTESQVCECSVIAVDNHEEMENLTLTPPVRVEAYLRKFDTDNFRVYFTPGRYTIQSYAPCIYGCTNIQDTMLTLLNGDKTILAMADDSGPYSPCDELSILINDEGIYYVSVTSFDSWKEMGRYGLVIRPTLDLDFHPQCTDQIKNHKWDTTAVEPTTGKWQTMCYSVASHNDYDNAINLQTVPFYVTKDSLEADNNNNKDYFLFEITTSSRYTFFTLSTSYDRVSEVGACWNYECNSIDTILELRDRYGAIVARNDDYFRSCSSVTKILDPGYYFIVVSAFAATSRENFYALVGVPAGNTGDSVSWCPQGTTPKVCPATSNSIHSIHPVWIGLFVAFCVFVIATIAIGLSTHCGRTFYRPLAAARTAGEGDEGGRDDRQVELDEFASS